MHNGIRQTPLIKLIAAMILASATVIAQPRPGGPEQMSPSVYFQAVSLLSSDSTRARIDLHYRVEENLFVPIRNADTSFPFAFRRSGEILVELTDSASGSVNRDFERVMIGADSAESGPGPKHWHQGFFSFSVRPGTYAINFELTDLDSRRAFSDRNRIIRIPKKNPVGFEVSDLLFIEKPGTPGVPAIIKPINFGGELLFGKPTAILMQIHPPQADSAANVRYTIASIPPSGSEPPEVSITDSAIIAPQCACILNPDKSSSEIRYQILREDPSAPSMFILNIPWARLPLRTYTMTLTFTQGKVRKDVVEHFRMIWPDMPMSLKDVDYALDVLRYITTPATLDSLRSGNYETRRTHLEAFWKRHDQTPETAYNEVMTEYYVRVDLAMRSFGTLRVPDGAKTDRGRIYILYGPPSRTKRTLDPHSAFEEVWIYERLNREFTFIDKNRNGTYELVQATNP